MNQPLNRRAFLGRLSVASASLGALSHGASAETAGSTRLMTRWGRKVTRKMPGASIRQLREAPPPVLKPIAPMGAGNQLERSFHMENVPGDVVVRMDGAATARIQVNGQIVKELTNADRAGYVPTSLALLSANSL